MAQSKDLCCGLYRGSFYLKDLGDPNGALLPIGNAEANISQTMTTISTDNFKGLGGKDCSLTFTESVSIALTVRCTKPENLAKAFLGEAFEKDGGNIIDEEHVVNDVNELVPFKNIPSKTSIVVTDDSGMTTYDVNKDYKISNSGIIILEGTTISLGSTIKVSYEFGKNWVIEAQTTSQKEYQLVLDGVNVGGNGERQMRLTAHKVKLSPTDSFALISGTDFASLNLNGDILSDDSQVTGSKFFNVEFGTSLQSQY